MQTHNTPKTNDKAIPVYSGSRIVGKVRGQTLFKSIQGSKHLLHRPPAICSDDSVLADAERAGAVEVKIRDTESGLTYSAPLSAFEKFGFPVRRGFGEQTGLPLTRWTVTREHQTIQPGQGESPTIGQYALADATPLPVFGELNTTEGKQLVLFTA